jgi:hypothetical protein
MDPDQTARIHAGRKPIMLVLSGHGSCKENLLIMLSGFLNGICFKQNMTEDHRGIIPAKLDRNVL